jgi:uncharacterized membrane protein
MDTETAQAVALVVATLTAGLLAGVFALYSHTIMPGLGKTDDRTFVAAFQATDQAIMNPLFLLTFVGTPVGCVASALLYLGEDDTSVVPWVLGALALWVLVFLVTGAANVPLNNNIKSAGEPDDIDVTAARAAFHEDRWSRWNLIRTVASLAAFGCLVWALVLHGRATAEDGAMRPAAIAGPTSEATTDREHR